jgi:tetratricopeptide (TPR) repeat protein
MLEQEPGNTFARYALAQEYGNSGRLEEAVAEFRRLVQHNPDYAAAWFHCGKVLERLGRPAEARESYRSGVNAAARTGDAHAQSEIQAALDALG